MTFTEKVYAAVSQIPSGRVSTYSAIARRIGCPNACRAVGNTLHKNPYAPIVPCHRVVSAKGGLARHFGYNGIDGHRERLSGEGVVIINDRVDLKVYGHNLP